MFGTNRALRKTIDYLQSALREAHEAVAEANRIRIALDEELNGRPAKYSMYHVDPGMLGVKGALRNTQRALGRAASRELKTIAALERVERHNAALREALTALGGTVIEL